MKDGWPWERVTHPDKPTVEEHYRELLNRVLDARLFAITNEPPPGVRELFIPITEAIQREAAIC